MADRFFALPVVGTLKARSSNSNEMISVPGIATESALKGYKVSEVVESANYLLRIGGLSVVEDDSIKFEATYKRGE